MARERCVQGRTIQRNPSEDDLRPLPEILKSNTTHISSCSGFYSVEVDVPRASELFFEISRRRVKAPWMARERCVHGRTIQCDPLEDDFKKCRRHPQGNEVAKKRFAYFSAFEKSVVVPGTGIETRHGCHARASNNKPEQQARATSQNNKKRDQ